MGKLGAVREWVKARSETGKAFQHLPYGLGRKHDEVWDFTVSGYDWASGSCKGKLSVGDLRKKMLKEVLSIVRARKGTLRMFWAAVDVQSMVPKQKAEEQEERQMDADGKEREEYPEGSCLTPFGVWNYSTGETEPLVDLQVIMNTRPMRKQLWALLAHVILLNAAKFPLEVIFLFDYEEGDNRVVGVAQSQPMRFMSKRLYGEADLQCLYAILRVNKCRQVAVRTRQGTNGIVQSRDLYEVPFRGRDIKYVTSDTDVMPLVPWLLACFENGVGVNTSKVYWNYPIKIGPERKTSRGMHVDMSMLCDKILEHEKIKMEVFIFCCSLIGNDFIKKRVFCNYISFDFVIWAMRMPAAVERIDKLYDPDDGFEAFEYLIAHLHECYLHYGAVRKSGRKKKDLCDENGHLLMAHQGGLGNRSLEKSPYAPDGVETTSSYEAVRKEVYRCKHGSKGSSKTDCAKCKTQDENGTRRHTMPTLNDLAAWYRRILWINSYWRANWPGHAEEFTRTCKSRSSEDNVLLAAPVANPDKLLVALNKEQERVAKLRQKERSKDPEAFDKIHLPRQANDPEHLLEDEEEKKLKDDRLTLHKPVGADENNRWARPRHYHEEARLLVIGYRDSDAHLVKASLDKWQAATCSGGFGIAKLITAGSGRLVDAVEQWSLENDVEHFKVRATRLDHENMHNVLEARNKKAVKSANFVLCFPFGQRPGTVRLAIEAARADKDLIFVDAEGNPYFFDEYCTWFQGTHKMHEHVSYMPPQEEREELRELLDEADEIKDDLERERVRKGKLKRRKPPNPVQALESHIRSSSSDDDDDEEEDDEESINAILKRKRD